MTPLAEINEFLTFLDAQKGVWTVSVHIPESSSHPLLTQIPDCLNISITFHCSSLAEVALHEVEAEEKKYSLYDITWENRHSYVQLRPAETRIKIRTSDRSFLDRCERNLVEAKELSYAVSTRFSPLKRSSKAE